MKLEVGKFYKTRDGRKAEVIREFNNSAEGKDYKFLVFVTNKEEGDEEESYSVTENGRYVKDEKYGEDLLDEWADIVHKEKLIYAYHLLNGDVMLSDNNFVKASLMDILKIKYSSDGKASIEVLKP